MSKFMKKVKDICKKIIHIIIQILLEPLRLLDCLLFDPVFPRLTMMADIVMIIVIIILLVIVQIKL